MFEELDNLHKYGSYVMVMLSMVFIAISGVFFGITYYIMDTIQTGFENTSCVIENNLLVESCQELWALALYPILNLKDLLIWGNIFFIFALALGMLIVGYKSGKSGYLLGVMVAFVGGITYFGIELSNIYRTLLENDIMREMLVDFTVYNKIMINFPWFCFFIGLFSVMLGLVNYQRTNVNKDPEELNY